MISRGNEEGTKGHQVHKFSPEGEVLMSLGTAGQPGTGPNQFNQPNDVITGPDGSIYVSDGHQGQGMTSNQAMEEGREAGATARILKFSPDGTFIKEWGQIGVRHGEFRTPHAMVFDSQDRLWVADRGNHRLEIFDQDGNYLESRYAYGRISGLFLKDGMVYAIDSESSPTNHPKLAQRWFASDRWTVITSLRSSPRSSARVGCIREPRVKVSPSMRTVTSTPQKGRTRSAKREARLPSIRSARTSRKGSVLVSKHAHRIDARGAARRHEACEPADEHHGDASEHDDNGVQR